MVKSTWVGRQSNQVMQTEGKSRWKQPVGRRGTAEMATSLNGKFYSGPGVKLKKKEREILQICHRLMKL